MTTFILVHGTGNTSADWPALQQSLTDVAKSRGQDARIKQVRWTGQNRATARQDAALQISDEVLVARSVDPTDKIFLIGHSHGGSAIAYFLKNSPQAGAIEGCAFLSTPFVAIRPRKLPGKTFNWMVGLAIATTLLALALLLLPEHSILFISISLAVLAASFFIIPLAKRKRADLGSVIQQETAAIPHGNYIFLRCSGDEAAAVLSSAQFIAWLGVKVSAPLERLTEVSNKFFVIVFFASAVILNVVGYDPSIAPDPIKLLFRWDITSIAHDLTVAVSVIIIIVLYGSIAAAFFILAAQAATARAFGWSEFFTGFLIEFAIEPLPFGTYALTHIDWATEGPEGMTHSWTWSHPAAIREVRNWVAAALDGRGD